MIIKTISPRDAALRADIRTAIRKARDHGMSGRAVVKRLEREAHQLRKNLPHEGGRHAPRGDARRRQG